MNMSYCRFENTARDLQDCVDNWDLDEDASSYEKKGKEELIELARYITEQLVEDDEE